MSTHGYTCNKTLRLDHYQNGSQRLTTPLRREADGKFTPVDWDTAIAEVAQRFAAVRDTQGGDKIFFYGDGGPGTIGLIASVIRPFCRDCDRARLTADGMIYNCLFANDETDLRPLLRDQDRDAEAIAAAWRRSLWNKAAGHGIDHPDFAQPDRPISAIGG